MYGNLFNSIITKKRKEDKKESYLSKVTSRHQKYILPSFANRDIKSIKYSEILSILEAIFNPNDPELSRLEKLYTD